MTIMKKYSKPQMMAKNSPTGSYAAGCPMKDKGRSHWHGCRYCERVE